MGIRVDEEASGKTPRPVSLPACYDPPYDGVHAQ